MKVEIGVMQPQAKEPWNHHKLEESRKDSPPWSLQRELSPANTLILDLWPPEL